MQRAVLDTDILSEILKQKDLIVAAHESTYAAIHGKFTLTAVSVHEIIYGLESKNARQQLRAAELAFEANDLLVSVYDDYKAAAAIRGIARRNGHQLALDDCLIAAVASRLGLPLVTGNTAHFEAAQNAGLVLTLQNWRNA